MLLCMNAGNELNFRGGHQQLRECGVHRSDSGFGAHSLQFGCRGVQLWCTLSEQFSAQCVRLAHSVQFWIWSTSTESFGAQSYCSSLHTVCVLQCAQIVQLWRIYRVCSAIYTWGASSAADSDAAGKDYGCRISEQLQKMCIITFECASLPRR